MTRAINENAHSHKITFRRKLMIPIDYITRTIMCLDEKSPRGEKKSEKEKERRKEKRRERLEKKDKG